MKKSIRFGMVQGRLTKPPGDELQWFPQESWQQEFKTASDLGIDYIELIAEVQHNENNPIWSENGIEEIKHLVDKNNLTLHALCNDYIIEHKLIEESVVDQNIKLLQQAEKLNIEKYIIPLFESSELNIDNMEEYVDPIREIAKHANNNGIITCLETILTGGKLLNLLEMIDRPYVKAVYDTGNRVAFGHDLATDIRLLGDRIFHVHIKDKDKNNSNVLLGTGLVNFEEVFYALRDIQYDGPFTFETSRGSSPLNTATYNINFVEYFKQNAETAI
jgi:L-ribulose-5-phosphate 3-epimerase